MNFRKAVFLSFLTAIIAFPARAQVESGYQFNLQENPVSNSMDVTVPGLESIKVDVPFDIVKAGPDAQNAFGLLRWNFNTSHISPKVLQDASDLFFKLPTEQRRLVWEHIEESARFTVAAFTQEAYEHFAAYGHPDFQKALNDPRRSEAFLSTIGKFTYYMNSEDYQRLGVALRDVRQRLKAHQLPADTLPHAQQTAVALSSEKKDTLGDPLTVSRLASSHKATNELIPGLSRALKQDALNRSKEGKGGYFILSHHSQTETKPGSSETQRSLRLAIASDISFVLGLILFDLIGERTGIGILSGLGVALMGLSFAYHVYAGLHALSPKAQSRLHLGSKIVFGLSAAVGALGALFGASTSLLIAAAVGGLIAIGYGALRWIDLAIRKEARPIWINFLSLIGISGILAALGLVHPLFYVLSIVSAEIALIYGGIKWLYSIASRILYGSK